jgi:hypothetical protein
MKKFGIILTSLGVITLLFTLNMDTTVETVGGMKVNNIGLMNDKQNYIIVSGILLVIGLLIFLFSTKNNNVNTFKDSNQIEKSTSPAKSGILFGGLFGVIMVLEFVIMYVIGMKSLVGTSFGTIINVSNYLILPVLFIFLGCSNYKKNINNGFISFGESLKTGVSIAFIAALIYALFNALFNIIFPEFIDEMISISKDAMLKENPNLTSKQLEIGISMVRKFSTPYISIPFTLAMYSFLGLIYSLIIGAFIKNSNAQNN